MKARTMSHRDTARQNKKPGEIATLLIAARSAGLKVSNVYISTAGKFRLRESSKFRR